MRRPEAHRYENNFSPQGDKGPESREGPASPSSQLASRTHLHDQVDGIGHFLQDTEEAVRGGQRHAPPPSLAAVWEDWLGPSVTQAPGTCSCPQHTAWAQAGEATERGHWLAGQPWGLSCQGLASSLVARR